MDSCAYDKNPLPNAQTLNKFHKDFPLLFMNLKTFSHCIWLKGFLIFLSLTYKLTYKF